jgi:putative DNA primase/helicase
MRPDEDRPYTTKPFRPARPTLERASGRSAARDAKASGNTSGELRQILIKAGELPRMADEAERALLASPHNVFVRGSVLVQPISEKLQDAKGRRTTIAKFRTLESAAMLDLLSRSATFVRKEKRLGTFTIADPPDKVVSILLDREGDWRVPRVAGVIATPTLRPDGSVLSVPGYDRATQLYLMRNRNLQMPTVPDQPTREDAERELSSTASQALDEVPSPRDGVTTRASIERLGEGDHQSPSQRGD